MKRLLSIIGAISLVGTSTTGLVACDNFIRNNGDKKLNPKLYKPQKPPSGSKWKLIDNNNSIK